MMRLEILICNLVTFNHSGETFSGKFLVAAFLQQTIAPFFNTVVQAGKCQCHKACVNYAVDLAQPTPKLAALLWHKTESSIDIGTGHIFARRRWNGKLFAISHTSAENL